MLQVYKDKQFSVDIETLELVSVDGSKTFDLENIFSLLEIVEEIDNFTTIGSISIADLTGIKEFLPLVGGETLRVTFKTDEKFEPYTKEFRIVKVGKEENLQDGKTLKVLNLYFASKEFLKNEQEQFSISYQGKLVSEIVQDIFDNQLEGETIEVETSKNTINFVIPYWNPFRSIQSLMMHGISAQEDDSAYLFFEDKEKYNFKSISSILKEPKMGGKVIELHQIENPDGNWAKLNIGAALYFEFIKTVDSTQDIGNGILGSSVYTFDYANKTFMYHTIDAQEYLNTGTWTLGKNSLYSKDWKFGKSKVEKFSSYIHDKIVNGYDYPNVIQQQVKSYLRNKNRYNILNNVALVVQKAGDSELTVGKIIEVEHKSSSLEKTYQPRLSGNYLISKVKHRIMLERGYSQILYLTKDAYSKDDENVTQQISSKTNP